MATLYVVRWSERKALYEHPSLEEVRSIEEENPLGRWGEANVVGTVDYPDEGRGMVDAAVLVQVFDGLQEEGR